MNVRRNCLRTIFHVYFSPHDVFYCMFNMRKVCMARRKFSAQNFCAEKEGKFCTASSTPPYEKWGEGCSHRTRIDKNTTFFSVVQMFSFPLFSAGYFRKSLCLSTKRKRNKRGGREVHQRHLVFVPYSCSLSVLYSAASCKLSMFKDVFVIRAECKHELPT
jgi:hypothetical protein